MLLLRDSTDFPSDISPQEMQKIIERYIRWGEGLRQKGVLRSSDKLRDGSGKIMRKGGTGPSVTDGPFVEGKEVVGGYYELQAANYDEVLQYCRDCPQLDFGSIEIREIEEMPK
jgi:hypothetical protein